MKHESTSSTPSLLSRILCSVVWVVIACWPDAVFLPLVVLSSVFIYIGGFFLLIVAVIILYGILYWLLMRWTVRIYPDGESWTFRLILQSSLVAFSMFVVLFINLTGENYQPMGFSALFTPDEQINFGGYISSCLTAFIQIVIWQYLAILLDRFLTKRKAQKQKDSSV